jgi:hypothetical protein
MSFPSSGQEQQFFLTTSLQQRHAGADYEPYSRSNQSDCGLRIYSVMWLGATVLYCTVNAEQLSEGLAKSELAASIYAA